MVGVKSATNPLINGCAPNNPSPACSNPLNVADPNSPLVHTSNDAVYIQPADPDHSVQGTHLQMFGNVSVPAPGAIPKMNGFATSCECSLTPAVWAHGTIPFGDVQMLV